MIQILLILRDYLVLEPRLSQHQTIEHCQHQTIEHYQHQITEPFQLLLHPQIAEDQDLVLSLLEK